MSYPTCGECDFWGRDDPDHRNQTTVHMCFGYPPIISGGGGLVPRRPILKNDEIACGVFKVYRGHPNEATVAGRIGMLMKGDDD